MYTSRGVDLCTAVYRMVPRLQNTELDPEHRINSVQVSYPGQLNLTSRSVYQLKRPRTVPMGGAKQWTLQLLAFCFRN